jgi:hypothetical protein
VETRHPSASTEAITRTSRIEKSPTSLRSKAIRPLEVRALFICYNYPMTSPHLNDKDSPYPVVGRHHLIDLSKYLVHVKGRNILDYEKIEKEDPELYKQILKDEHEADRMHDEELDKLLSGE